MNWKYLVTKRQMPDVPRQIGLGCNYNTSKFAQTKTLAWLSNLSRTEELHSSPDAAICTLTTLASHCTGNCSLKNLQNFCKVQISIKWKLFMLCWPVLGWPCCTSQGVVVVPSICTLIFRILAAMEIWFGQTRALCKFPSLN